MAARDPQPRVRRHTLQPVSRIAEDLRGLVAGDVLADDLSRRLYATDASLYEITPLAVVRPRSLADVVATVRYAAQERVPVHARGAGSGLAGGALGEGIVVDFSRYTRQFLADEGVAVRVQPGLVHADLNRRLAASGRLFGPDPAMTEVTTLGGVVAVDASGSHRPVYGSAREHVEALTVVLADGEVLRLDRNPARLAPAERAALAPFAERLGGLLRSRRDVIRENTPRGCASGSGYALDRCLARLEAAERAGEPSDGIDLVDLFVGSEGTLGLVTEMTLGVVPAPAEVGGVLLTFSSLDRAAEGARRLADLGVAACDLMDRRHVSHARAIDPRYDLLLAGDAEAVLYVEAHAEDERELADRQRAILDASGGDPPLATGALVADSPGELRLFRDLSRRFVPTLHGLKGVRRATPGVEDIVVPPTALAQFFARMQETLKRRQVTASVFGHAAHGQLHIRPLLDLTAQADLRKLESLAGDLYDTVWLLGGSVTGEHGDGLSRTPFTSRQHGPLVNVFREAKRVFDPHGLLNPGKIVPAPGARMTHGTRLLRPASSVAPSGEPDAAPPDAPSPPELVTLQLAWSIDEAAQAARACNGCGACRAQGPDVRMCPIFRVRPAEEASPRAKANLIRGVLTGALPADTLAHDDAREIADLCVHCHQCRLECPAEVDIPRLMLEAKAAHVKAAGLRVDSWFASRLDAVAALASRAPRLTNRLMASPRFRWLLERSVGLAAGRRLPPFARRPYLKRSGAGRKQRPSAQADDRVVYFVDTYANYFDPELAEALERILARHGVAVYAPAEQLASGMTMIAQGLVEDARRIAERNVSLLAEAVRQGHTVVATEPAAALALTHEYPQLLAGDEDTRLVADHTYEACQYLWRRHQEARLQLDLQPLPFRVAYHQPCHSRALAAGAAAENLLRLIPGLDATPLHKGCSGMAGAYGLLRKNYRSSLRAGLPMLRALRLGAYDFASTECGACRTQIEQSSPLATLHPVKLLAASYGLMPGVRARLERGRDS